MNPGAMDRAHGCGPRFGRLADSLSPALPSVLRCLARVCAAVIAAGLVCGAFAGCASTSFYRPHELPANLQARAVPNPHTADLINLGAPDDGGERIAPGDLLEISIYTGSVSEAPDKFEARVHEQTGIANLQMIGPMRLAGLELEEAEAEIAKAAVARNLYRSPYVTVSFKHRRKNRVLVIGAVQEPGLKELSPSGSHLLGALVAAGGLTKEAGPKVTIRLPDGPGPLAPAVAADGGSSVRPAAATRSVPKTIEVNLVSATEKGPQRHYLPDGAIVMVEKLEPEPLKVLGLVKKPGHYDFPIAEPVRVLDAVAMAGGVSNGLADKILVIRSNPQGGEPAVIRVSLRRAKRDGQENLLLAPGDVVTVEQTPETVLLEALKVIRFAVSTGINSFF